MLSGFTCLFTIACRKRVSRCFAVRTGFAEIGVEVDIHRCRSVFHHDHHGDELGFGHVFIVTKVLREVNFEALRRRAKLRKQKTCVSYAGFKSGAREGTRTPQLFSSLCTSIRSYAGLCMSGFCCVCLNTHQPALFLSRIVTKRIVKFMRFAVEDTLLSQRAAVLFPVA
jgi:hypothetical protein